MENLKSNKKNEIDAFSGLTENEIKGFVETQHDFINGKTTARNWDDIEKDLDLIYKEKI